MKAIINFISTFLLFVTALHLHAQSKSSDSLLNISKTGQPKQQVDALNALANLVVYDKPEKAKQYAQVSINIAKSIAYDAGLGDAYNRIGIAYDISGKYDSSIFFYEKALPIYNRLKNLKGRGSALNNLGLIYWNLADYDKALQYFFDALKDFEEIGNSRFTANALNNIGLVYEENNKLRQALVYHHKAEIIYEKINDPYLKGAVYNNLGNAYSTLKIIDTAEYYYKKAMEIQQISNDDYGLSIAYSGFATLMMNKNRPDVALDYYTRALSLKEKLNEIGGQCMVLLSLAQLYRSKNNSGLEIKYLDKAKGLSEKNNLKKELISIYKRLSEFYEKSNEGLSLNYYKKYTAVKDSVFNETNNHQINELNTKYETGKKELKLKEQDLTITRKNFFIGVITGALILISLLGFSYYKKYQLKQDKKLQSEVIKQQDLATTAIITAEENERKRIAADLHDGVGQMMSAAKMNLSAIENEISFKDASQKIFFEKVIGMIDESCKEIRSVSHQMMPNALLKSGLASAVKEFLDRIDNRVIKINLHAEGLQERLESNTETILYRVIQECVNNVIKHSGATNLYISLIKDVDGIAATVEDNGRGFDTTDKQKFEGIGLKNISSRVAFLKGTVDFDSSPGKGTLVAIHIPIAHKKL